MFEYMAKVEREEDITGLIKILREVDDVTSARLRSPQNM